ncbi:DUF3299 domain-containing protein [Aliivibrio fischeri]|uniref:DUF3299 domain-containing protein n=1 Tax=Aliivibrio fischeri TaxID=668 RepID=UPI0012D856F1|nr:DUF3299 domain-containing protein [Aliivibrio fischeri]MUK62362.1 DUF3299 domain-containing protein [Aliivibrio fischeri]MUL03167.1 DUF3299 domain-containing protein [Aliivibrio fischeri]MUL21368.1 DUF3299 domain-containing protein [Aliivibrio fischeri]MUL23609.1 DUF3299 domain-containing protein [Aliivibrio fischeri]
MISLSRFLFLVCCLFLSSNSYASEQWSWRDLVSEESKSFIDPFIRFSSMQKYDLYNIMNYIEDKNNLELKANYEIAIQRFSDSNIDILKLIEQRLEIAKQRNSAQNSINKSLIGKTGRLPGYIVPLEMDGMLVTQFLLVPTAGACIHTPPPPANQIVLVTPKEGIELISLYTPVWIEGELSAGNSKSDVQLSDGIAEVDTAYTMLATSVELYN